MDATATTQCPVAAAARKGRGESSPQETIAQYGIPLETPAADGAAL